jgi:hypothetical protein
MNWIASLPGLLDAEEWQAVGTMGTLAVAIVAAVFAFFQVREAARQRRDQSRPYVVAYVDRVAPTILDLVVKNFGTTAARDVVLHWDRPVTLRWAKEAEPLELFERLPVLVPGQEWRTVWDLHGHRIEDKEEPYIVRVTSRDARRRRLPEERFDLDTRHFAFEMMWDQNGLHEIGESLKKLERAVSHWGDGSDGLKVWARDGDAKDKRWAERWEASRARRDQIAGRTLAPEAASTTSAKKRAPRKKPAS